MKNIVLCILLIAAMFQSPAAVIVVNGNGDTVDPNDGKCTLREALLATNFNVVANECGSGQAAPVQDVIELLPSVMNDAIQTASTLGIIEAVSIEGPGAEQLLILPATGHNGHIFQINTTGQDAVHFSGFRIGGARSSAVDIVACDEVIFDGVNFLSNTASASDSFGGAINGVSVGWLRVYNSAFSNNQADRGGAIYLDDTLMEIENSVFTANTATNGGAIYNYGTFNSGVVSVLIHQSHFSANQNTLTLGNHKIAVSESVFYQNNGGSVFYSEFNNGSIINSLFAENTANVVIHQNDISQLTVSWNTFVDNQGFEISSTLGSNPPVQRNAFSTTNGCTEDGSSSPSYSRNVDSGDSCSGIFNYDIRNTDPLLLPVAYYGGNVLIAPPSPISPLVDVDASTACDALSTDLSGEGRSRDGDADGMAACDIGAVERPVAYNLNVDIIGNGDGQVDLVEFAMVCYSPDVCDWPLQQGLTFLLEPVADNGSQFVGWTGACSGNGNCLVTMNSAQNVTAEFASVINPVTLTLNTVRTDNYLDANVTSNPIGISCGATCSFDFAENETVVLTANPQSDTIVDFWDNCHQVSMDGLSCTIHLGSMDDQVDIYLDTNPDIIFKDTFDN
jgi:CSLREA domain-containing protein